MRLPADWLGGSPIDAGAPSPILTRPLPTPVVDRGGVQYMHIGAVEYTPMPIDAPSVVSGTATLPPATFNPISTPVVVGGTGTVSAPQGATNMNDFLGGLLDNASTLADAATVNLANQVAGNTPQLQQQAQSGNILFFLFCGYVIFKLVK